MADFGFSVGDVVYAIKILYTVIQAFDESKGAKKKYALSSGFLRQLVPVLERLEDQIKEASSEERRQELLVNAKTIKDAYGVFEDYIRNKYSGLSTDDASKLRQIIAKMKWSIDELHDKVQKLKSDITAAMQPYMALMLQDICVSVEYMAEDFQKASSSSEESSKRIQQITTMLKQIQDQDQNLHAALLDYQSGLAEEEREHRWRVQQSLSDIQKTQRSQPTRADLEAAKETTTSQIEVMQADHLKLIKSRDELLVTMQRQQHLALDEIEAARWERLQDQEEKRAAKQAAEQEKAQKNIGEDMKAARTIVTGFTDVAGNKAAKRKVEKFGTIGEIVVGFGSIFERRVGSAGDSGIDAAAAAGQPTTRRSPSPRPTTGYGVREAGTRFPAAPPPFSLTYSASSPNGPTSPSRTPKPPPPLPTTPPPKTPGTYLSVSSDLNADRAMSRRRNSESRLSPAQHPPSSSRVSLAPEPPSSFTQHCQSSIRSQTSSEPLRPALPPRPRSDISPKTAGNAILPSTSVATGATAAAKQLSATPPTLPPRNKPPTIIIADSTPSAPKTTIPEAKTSASPSPRWKIQGPPSPVSRPTTPTTLTDSALDGQPSTLSSTETVNAPSEPSRIPFKTAKTGRESNDSDGRETASRFVPPRLPPSPPSTPSSQLPTFADRKRMFEEKANRGGIPIMTGVAARKGEVKATAGA
ncbi:hypothetical protein KC336_g19371 [Hortaea werneckii]|nr:hypothetical protein KC336_g19371 [Hortaea werneckii]